MTWVAVFVVAGLVLAIAAALVFREAARLSEEPPDAVFDPDDALGWVVAHLDDLTAATLTERDAERIIGAQMEFLRERGVTRNGSARAPEVPVVFSTDEAVHFILERCAATGEAYLPEQVEAVMSCQMEYLRFIGAVGGPADEAEG
jgi:hypothetical protein